MNEILCLECNKPVDKPVFYNGLGPFHASDCASAYFGRLMNWLDSVEQIEEGGEQ